MVRFAIVDDEEICVRNSAKFIDDFFEKDKSAYKITVYRDGIDLLENYTANFDIILMDIEMKHLDGMKTAEKLRMQDPDVILIFITKMIQYAARGYDVDAIGYLIKPIDYFSFQMKMKKAMILLEQKQSVSVVVSDNYQKKVLPSRSIYYIEVIRHTVIFHTKHGEVKSWGSLKEFKNVLEPVNFVQCSRFFLINLEYVTAVSENTVIINNEEIPLSRSQKKNFTVRLTEYCGGIRRVH